ncbi:hypothetical protein SDC9_71994 [bioreactor metagenome]|uniref:DUF304 domain-containing protein n=1 Tax=bioreactor metagenome TaxID=1076179 RepID=A0A644YB15_9ZZZZ
MEIYRELSQYNSSKLLWLWLAIIVLVMWLGKEVHSILAGKPSFTGVAYVVLFGGLLVWRYAVRYTYSLTNRQIIIISHFLWFSRTFTVDLSMIESYSGKYVRSIFKRNGIKRYVHRYSSGDSDPTRIIIFNHKGERQALLIRVGEKFADELSGLIPGKCQ